MSNPVACPVVAISTGRAGSPGWESIINQFKKIKYV